MPANARFVDGTFGAGGYSRALLDRSPQIRVYAIDRDPEAIARGAEMLRAYEGRFRLLEGRFSEMEALLRDLDVHKLAGITLDIGVSSYQLETAARGFSFQLDGPLDMRMGGEGPSAADLVNGKSEEELATSSIIWAKTPAPGKSPAPLWRREPKRRSPPLCSLPRSSRPPWAMAPMAKRKSTLPPAVFRLCALPSMMSWASFPACCVLPSGFWRRKGGLPSLPFILLKIGSSKPFWPSAQGACLPDLASPGCTR
nr:16S rRNA (cytosine(1402)-N(4))-methyltransferase [Iodidimonas nitroreducens]